MSQMALIANLDINTIASIGLMFLDGDAFETMLLGAHDRQVDYDFDKFNKCKAIVMKMERMNPEKGLTVFLWQLRPDNPDVILPLVAGRQLPRTGYSGITPTPPVRAALAGKFGGCVAEYEDGAASHYYPIKNSDDEIVGVLEVLTNNTQYIDI